MGLLKRFFAPKDPLAAMRRAVEQARWADAVREGECIAAESLSAADATCWEELRDRAGDGLAEINLVEGQACLRASQQDRAREHFLLADTYARSAELQRCARDLLTACSEAPVTATSAASLAGGGCCATGCATSVPESPAVNTDLDRDTQLEFVLSSYPPPWAERYTQASAAFHQVLLLAHEEREEEALAGLESIPEGERDDLYFFERGALLVRMGEHHAGRQDLERAVALNAQHVLALETLVRLDLLEQQPALAKQHLETMLAGNLASAFCHGRLAMLSAAEGDEATAIAHGEHALEYGSIDLETLLLLSSLYEKAGRLTEAENLLGNLPSVGCGGAPHVLLAEFWLRQGKLLNKALESFKVASRQEPQNPRWPLRIAQACLALGWHQDGLPLLERLLATPQLDPALRQEAQEIYSFYGK